MSRALLGLVFPPDPGQLRLLAAFRATLAAVSTFFLVMLLGNVIEMSDADRILGFAIALFMTATVRDGTRRQQFVTMALALPSALFTTTLATFLLDRPMVAAVAVPPIMFGVAYGAAHGARYGSIGMVGLIAYTVSLVSQQPPDTLPVRFLVLLLAVADAVVVRCLLFPESPSAELLRLRRAIRSGIAEALDHIAAAVSTGHWTAGMRVELRRDIYRLGETIMLAQTRVTALSAQLPEQGPLWLQLLAIQLAAERVARVALAEPARPTERQALLVALQAMRHGAEPPAAPQPDSRLGAALSTLRLAEREMPSAGLRPAAPPPPVGAPTGLRPAIQTAIAAALAVFAGNLVSPNRWYWAAFTAFVMFQGTRSRGESIAKGVRFMIGTSLGVLAGMLLGTLLSDHEILTMTAIVGAVFLAFQANVVAYGVMVFWITIILGLMFAMLGYFAPELLLLRLEEAGAGAACGALVASVVLVRRDRSATQDAIIALLRALGQSVDSATRRLLDGTVDPDMAVHILTAEQRFHDLSAIARPQTLGLSQAHTESLRRELLVLEACELAARELGRISLQSFHLDDPVLARSMRRAAERIDATVANLVDHLVAGEVLRPVTTEPDGEPVPAGDDDRSRAVRLAIRIDAGLVHMAARLAGTPTGWSVDTPGGPGPLVTQGHELARVAEPRAC